jgi:AcrR family transcriptional regulator
MLLESAVALFGNQGFHATSVQEIVQGAGLTKGAFYHHFASKEDVLRLIHDEFLDVQERLVDEILEEYDSPVDQIRELVRASALSTARYRTHVAVFFQERRFLTGKHVADVKEARDRMEEKIEGIVRRGIEAGDFEPALDAQVAVFGVVGMTAWLHQWYRPGGQLSAEAIADQLARMTLEGLRRHPAEKNGARARRDGRAQA